MAIYSCNISNVSRSKGSSACATLSYISAEKIRDERTGELYNYGREQRVIEVATMLPAGAPQEYEKAERLFNSIENFEKAENARTAKKIIVALPREFDLDMQSEVIREFIEKNITSKGYACTYAIHHDKDNSNPHCHILIANRQIDSKTGKWANKRKMEYALDDKGERIPLIDKSTGKQKVDSRNRKQWKRISVESNPMDSRETLKDIRISWAEVCNKRLSQDKKIDHRSYEEQFKDKDLKLIPTIHEGYEARAIEAQGGISERCEYNRQVKSKNNLLRQISEELKQLSGQIKELVQEKGAELNERIGNLLRRRAVIKSAGRTSDRERTVTSAGGFAEETADITELISSARNGITDSTAKEENSRAERADREAERERLNRERERKAQERKLQLAREREEYEASFRDYGPSL